MSSAGTLGQVFDLDSLPGARSTTEQWYTELAVALDTRLARARISPGARIAGHSGFSRGVGGDASRYWLGGMDGSLFLPVIQRDRIVAARLVLDVIRNLENDVPLAFTEYPRHPLFRGISPRKLLRSDERSLLSSLEYQWPLTATIGGHLMVADEFAGFSAQDAVWAGGFGLDFHVGEDVLGGVQLTSGTEGFRFLLQAGFSGDSDLLSEQK